MEEIKSNKIGSEIQEINVFGELSSKKNANFPPIYTWDFENNIQSKFGHIDWVGPITGLLEKGDLKRVFVVNDPRSEKIKFNFKVGEDSLGYAIYDSRSKGWKEGHVEKILDEDTLMLNVAEKMEKIIDLLRIPNEKRLNCLCLYKLVGNVCDLVVRVNRLIEIKNNELGSLKANIPLLLGDDNSYKNIDNRANGAIKFLKSQIYKEYTNKKKVGAFKKIKRGVKKVFNEITGREKVDDLYKDIEKSLKKLSSCSFVDELTPENKEVIDDWKNEKIDSKMKNGGYFAEMNSKLCKIVGELLRKYPNSQLKSLYKNGVSRLVTSDANIKPILKQYGIIDPNETLKEAVVCEYVLKILKKLNYSPASKLDEETMNNVKMKEVVKKYGKVINKFSKDKERVQPRMIIADGYDAAKDLKGVCEEFAGRYGLENFERFRWNDSNNLDKELDKRYGKLPEYGSSVTNRSVQEEAWNIRNNSRYIAYSDYILTKLLGNEYKPESESKTDECSQDSEYYAHEKGYNEDIDKVIKDLDNIKIKRSMIYYLNVSSGLGSIGANDKKWKKWNGYMKDKIKDLNSAISDYIKKYSLDDKYLKEAEFVSILYILSRSVERAPDQWYFAKYLKDFGGELASGFYIPESIKDSSVAKEAGRKLYKVCYEALPKDYELKGLPKKSCVKILECISKYTVSEESENIEQLRALEKKIKSKLKAN